MWLIFGVDGQLGSCLFEKLDTSGVQVTGTTFPEVDITNQEQVDEIVSRSSAKVIVNAAAWTNVVDAEVNETLAFNVNAIGAGHIANASVTCGAKFFQLSTDYVFSGNSRIPYSVSDLPQPINAYGRTKLAGENAVLNLNNVMTSVVRTAWLYSARGNNFAKTIAKRAIAGLASEVVEDQRGQPTSARDLADFLISIEKIPVLPRIIHGTSSGDASWYEFAREIYRQLGQDPELVLPIGSRSLVGNVNRPKYSVLDHSDIEQLGISPIQSWEAGLKEVIQDIKKSVLEEVGE